jgi:hypothetical protein
MRAKILLLFAVFLLTGICNAQEKGKFFTAMQKSISLLNSAKSISDYQDAGNMFERIGNTEKSQWLPFYYAAYANIIVSSLEPDKGMKDTYLDKADNFLASADSLAKNNSELLALKAFSAEMRISVNPMTRWQKYGGIFSIMIAEAIKADTTNPRPEMLQGQMILYTPEQFGGGAANAKPILQASLKKFDTFKPESEIHPNWGKHFLEGILKGIDNK